MGELNAVWVFAYFIIISLITLYTYWSDKKRAEFGGFRTPESTLHFLALLGGSPAAYFAQHIFRHKTKKKPFIFLYWIIVAFQILIVGYIFV